MTQPVPIVGSANQASALRLALFTDTYAPQVNGVARTLERLVQAVRARGGDVRVFTTCDPDATADSHVSRYASTPFWAYPQLQLAWPSHDTMLRAVRDYGPTLIHAATEFGMGLAGRRVARALNVPFVSSYHTSFTAYASHYRLGFLATPGWSFLRWFHNGGRRTYCPTEAIVREVESKGFERCRVWSRGVDAERFSPAFRSEALRTQLTASDDTLVVSYVGRLASEKGLDVALDAVRLADQARPGRLRFMVVGDGPYESTVRSRATAGTHLLGRLSGSALSEAFASSDLFLFPSTTDTFGNVMLEAMASGVPVLGADVGPTRELLAPDRGWLADASRAAAFARTIIDVIDDRARLEAMRARALAYARTRSWDTIWNELLADYLTVHAATANPRLRRVA